MILLIPVHVDNDSRMYFFIVPITDSAGAPGRVVYRRPTNSALIDRLIDVLRFCMLNLTTNSRDSLDILEYLIALLSVILTINNNHKGVHSTTSVMGLTYIYSLGLHCMFH